MIKGLIFDLDGVITETATLHYQAWKQEVKKINLDYSEKQNSSLKGLNRIDTLKAILKIFNVNLDESEILKMANSKNEIYKKLLETEISEKNILPNIKEFLINAKQKNLKLAIASSSYNAPLILKKINLYHFFDFIVDPSTINNGKPDPEIFLKAAKELNLKPEQTIGFEDAIAGVKGLKAAKINAVAITHKENENWAIADLVYESTSDLDLDFILKHFSKI
ncbi:beta-phosphoglucomutase [Mesomycoplasma lagogenitalium]|uniref:Beta-phosphoglucomutase n=1 Tax=Mesomycoplasma lagogenitalium TaxID=171286 RepID=A0ABY8LU47_9BACT|nr:beta-phosphoglucomutase [Mesomycoplasma lagogenitalium]WGI36754.1 beta-phosphoglucomutase [Mesomycoplasma lagogenitalium]